MDASIKIRIGSLEVEFSGSESFVRDELVQFVEKIAALGKISKQTDSLGLPDTGEPGKSSGGIELTTGQIATKIKASSGTELALAAAARLTIVDDKPKFTRKELLREMRSASSFFKDVYRKNLTQTLKTLQKSKLNETSKDTYALRENVRQELIQIIADD